MDAPSNAVRPLKGIENFFAVGFKQYGLFYVVSHYTFNRPLKLSQLEVAATKLRNRHQILGLDTVIDVDNGRSWFVEGEDKKVCVLEKDKKGGDGMMEVMNEEIDSSKRIYEEAQEKGYLPWRVVLVGDRDVLFGAPHHVTDGRSMGIVGSDLVRFLNGVDVEEVVKLGPGIEGLFGEVGWWGKISNVMYLLKGVLLKPDLGLEMDGHAEEWSDRKRTARRVDCSFEELEGFRRKCKNIEVNLNSGFVSAMYEALAKHGLQNPKSKKLQSLIAMDARTRVKEGSALTRKTMGAYIGGATACHTGEAERWEERARAIHQKVNSDFKTCFSQDAFVMGTVGRYPRQAMHPMITDKKTEGRLAMLGTSNLGRLEEIEKANKEVLDKNLEAITMERMVFGDNAQGMGWLVNFYASTIGKNVGFMFSAEAPLINEDTLDSVVKHFFEIVLPDRKL